MGNQAFIRAAKLMGLVARLLKQGQPGIFILFRALLINNKVKSPTDFFHNCSFCQHGCCDVKCNQRIEYRPLISISLNNKSSYHYVCCATCTKASN